ncbi:MAG: FAD-dependent monooxygenase [Actinophytocola sp.]|uniref:FAD-dependent monooxygenase n=1 Tax=Actinophytocola sp. TaxID=1872138 RepID=UPI003C76EAA5
MTTEDVVIAGAGPNGLMLACELSLAGVRPVVLERLSGHTKEHRANGLVGQVVRLLDRRGLHERLSGNQDPPFAVPRYVFGALPLELSGLDDNPLTILPVPQHRIEEVLAERAVELGAEIRRGHELTGLRQDADGVTVEVAGGDRIRTSYLVGADGGHSTTRKLAGIGFPGVTRDNTISRQAHASVPAELIDPATGGFTVPGYGLIPPLMHHRTERGLFVYAPMRHGTMVITMEFSADFGADVPDEPMTLDELRASARRVLGVDVPILPPEGDGPHLVRRLTGGNTRIADRFRDGRVLLVGDAAHVHSAIGGPGLNLGLQDAVNLGWKLAAEVRGRAPAGLLDTYESERRPASERVVMHTQAQSALIAPGSDVTALRELCTELLRDKGNVRHIAAMMAGADLRYEVGGTHPLAGRWAPDLVLHNENGPVRLAELTRSARPLLLDLTEDGTLGRELSGGHDRVDTVTARAEAAPATALLVRPDGYVAWASSSARPDGGALRAAMARWFDA